MVPSGHPRPGTSETADVLKSRACSGVSDRIRLAREQARLAPAELRHRLRQRGIELSKTGLHRIESTEPRNPNLRLVETIAEITGVSAAWLLFGERPSAPVDAAEASAQERVLETIELLSGALDLDGSQEKALQDWLRSVRRGSRSRR